MEGMTSGILLFVPITVMFIMFVTLTEIGSRRKVKSELRFLDGLSLFLDGTVHYYRQSHDVRYAIVNAADEAGPEMAAEALKIEEMLASCDPQEQIGQYMSGNINRFLKLFVSFVSLIAENGDSEGEHGSVFIGSVTELRREVRAEHRHILSQKHAYGGLTLTAALPLVAVPFISLWCTDTLSGTKSFYFGRAGWLSRTFLLVISYAGYSLVTFLRSGDRTQEKQEEKKGRRLAFVLTGLMAGAVCCLGGRYDVRNDLMNDTSSIRNSFEIADRRLIDVMCTYVPQYTRMAVDGELGEELGLLVPRLLQEKGMREGDAESIADEVRSRFEAVKKESPGLSDVIIIILSGIAGLAVPAFAGAVKAAVIRGRRDEEVRRFQTVIHIMKGIPGMTTMTVLSTMESFAVIFRRRITECINSFSISERGAFEELAENEDFLPLKRLVDSFLMIDEEGIEGAFAGISDGIREFSKDREQERMLADESEGLLAKVTAVIPGGFILFGYMLLPFLAGALSLFETYQAKINSLL